MSRLPPPDDPAWVKAFNQLRRSRDGEPDYEEWSATAARRMDSLRALRETQLVAKARWRPTLWVGGVIAIAALAGFRLAWEPSIAQPQLIISPAATTLATVGSAVPGDILWGTNPGRAPGPLAVVETATEHGASVRLLDPSLPSGKIPVTVVHLENVPRKSHLVATRDDASGLSFPRSLPAVGDLWVANAYTLTEEAGQVSVATARVGLAWRDEPVRAFVPGAAPPRLSATVLALEGPDSAGEESLDAVASIGAPELAKLRANDRTLVESKIAELLDVAAGVGDDWTPSPAPTALEDVARGFPIVLATEITFPFREDPQRDLGTLWCAKRSIPHDYYGCVASRETCEAGLALLGDRSPSDRCLRTPRVVGDSSGFSLSIEPGKVPLSELKTPSEAPGCDFEVWDLTVKNGSSGWVILNFSTPEASWPRVRAIYSPLTRAGDVKRGIVHSDGHADVGSWWLVLPNTELHYPTLVSRCALDPDAPVPVLFRVFGASELASRRAPELALAVPE